MKYLKGFNWIGIQHTDFKKETRTISKSKFHDEISTVKSCIKETAFKKLEPKNF